MRGVKSPGLRKQHLPVAIPDICLLFFSLFVVAMTVVPFFILCCYNHPGDNDNWYVFRSFLDRGGPDLSLFDFFSFRGSFNLPNFFFSPLYRHPDGMTKELFSTFLRIYHFSAAFYVVLFWGSLTILFFSLDRTVFHFGTYRNLFFYSFFIYLAFNSVHYPTMAFYDLVSSSGYNAGLSYFFLFVSFAFLAEAESRWRWAYCLFCILFCVACIFSMEYFPFVCGFVSFAFIVWTLLLRQRFNVLHAALLALCLLVFARNFLIVRTLVVPDSDGYVGKYTGGTDSGLTVFVTMGEMMKSLAKRFCFYLYQLLTQRRYLPAIAVLTIGSARALRKRGFRIPVWTVLPFFLIILGTAAVFSFATPEVFVMPRYAWTLYVMIFLFITSLLIAGEGLLTRAFGRAADSNPDGDCSRVRDGMVEIAGICRRIAEGRNFLIVFTAVGTLLFAFFALKDSESVVANAWKDLLKGDAADYSREMQDRYDAIFSAGEGEPVYLLPIEHRPKSLFIRDSMEFEVDRNSYRRFFDNKFIYLKVGDQILQ